MKAGARVFRIGPAVDLTYPVTELGNDLAVLGDLPREVVEAFEGKPGAAVIVGMGALRAEGAYQAARAAAAALGASLRPASHGRLAGRGARPWLRRRRRARRDPRRAPARLKALFLLGADEIDMSAFADTFTVYIGTHGDRGVRHADVILPAAAYTEKHGTYVNLEGRVQLSEMAVHPPGEAREDWTIVRALSDVLGKTLPFDDLGQLRRAIAAEVPRLGIAGLTAVDPLPAFAGRAPKVAGEIVYPIDDFYLTNPIARASPTLRAARPRSSTARPSRRRRNDSLSSPQRRLGPQRGPAAGVLHPTGSQPSLG